SSCAPLHATDRGRHLPAPRIDELPLALRNALLGTQHLGFVLFQIRCDVSLRAGQRLPPFVVGGYVVTMGVRDLDVVTEDFIEADLERPNSGSIAFARLS